MTEAQKLGRYGAFRVPINGGLVSLICIADDGSFGPLPLRTAEAGQHRLSPAIWEHVSVTAKGKGTRLLRAPLVSEVQLAKLLFFQDNEAVALYFPPQGTCFSIHPQIVHLWRPVTDDFPLPPVKKL